MKRITIDIALILAVVAVSFLFTAPTLHSQAVAGSLRIFAGVYAVVAIASRVLSDRARAIIDMAAASMYFLKAWWESFPAGNHSTEIGVFIAIGVALMALALSGPRRTVIAA